MNRKYLGSEIVNVKDTPFKDYTSNDWAMYFISNYSQIDGAHHKQWCIDIVAQVLKGSPVEVTKSTWDDGYIEYSADVKEESLAYKDWIQEMLGEYSEEDHCYEYSYDKGTPP